MVDTVINAPDKLVIKNTDAFYSHLQCLQNPAGSGNPGILEISQSRVKVLNDISAYGGALMTAGNPSMNNGCGGGAIQMGHAFTATGDQPMITLTDAPSGYNTLWIKQGTSNPALTLATQWEWGNLALNTLYAHGVVNILGSNAALNICDSGGYVSHVSLSHDGSNSHLTSNSGLIVTASMITGSEAFWFYGGDVVVRGGYHLLPEIDGGGQVGRDGRLWGQVWTADVRANNFDCFGGGSGSEAGHLGSSSHRYYELWARVFHGYTNGGYDEYDDLAIVKQWGEKQPKIPENYNPSKIKPKDNDPFSMLRSKEGDEYFNIIELVNFSLGVGKALAKKQDECDQILLEVIDEKEKMSKEITDLRKQLQELAAKGGVSA